MRLPWMREPRVMIDGELATYHFHFWSPDIEFDSIFTKEIERFDQHELESNVRDVVMGRMELECRRLVAVYFPKQVEIRNFRILYDRSVTVTFALIWTGAVSLYVLLSRYDSFRRSLERLKDDVSRFLGRVGRRSHRPRPVVADTDWTPGRLFIELEELFTFTGSPHTRTSVDRLFLWYLIGTNIILASVLFVMVYHAVATMYFK